MSEIGQVGTQFDGFAHQTHENSWYNCFKVAENAARSGFTFGKDHAPPKGQSGMTIRRKVIRLWFVRGSGHQLEADNTG